MFTQTKMYLWYQKQVVDARAGPGMKSMTKFKSKHKKMCESGEKSVSRKKKHFEREYSPTLSEKSEGNHDVEMADVDFMTESGPSGRSSRTASPGGSDCEDNISVSRRHKGVAKRRDNIPQVSDFVDLDFWRKEKICCGTIFRGLNGEVLLDQRFLKPCNARLANCKLRRSECKTESDISDTSSTKVYNSDSSSDSGYDESSNPGNVADSTATSSAYKKAETVPSLSEPETSSSISEIHNEIPKAN